MGELEYLIKEISLGNKDAFKNFYDLTKRAIFSYSLTILKNYEDAKDNMQDVYIKIYENLNNYQRKEKLMNWIMTITRNLALMKIRKNQKIIPEEINLDILVSKDTVNEDKIIIKELMECLNNEEQQIVILHLIGGLKHRDIATLLDLKLSTCLSKYNRALKKLKIKWER